jgi:hypothetical protein
MARVASIKTLELIRGEALLRRPGSEAPSPGICIRVLNVVQDAKARQTIDVMPTPQIIDAGEPD